LREKKKPGEFEVKVGDDGMGLSLG